MSFTDVLSRSTPRTPALSAVSARPSATASAHRNAGMLAFTGFSPTGSSGTTNGKNRSRTPEFVPGSPTLPVRIASIGMARAESSPASWRCGPHPCATKSAFACAISRASATMRRSGTPVMAHAHAGVLGVASSPVPRM